MSEQTVNGLNREAYEEFNNARDVIRKYGYLVVPGKDLRALGDERNELQDQVTLLRAALRAVVHLPAHNPYLTIRERLDSVVEIAQEALKNTDPAHDAGKE